MKLASVIINRNLPQLVDPLGDELLKVSDALYVLENGSDPDKRSKHANIIVEESNGAGWAVNHVIQRCIDDGYDLVWVNYNDAWYNDFEGFVGWFKQVFELNQHVGIIPGYWENVWDMNGQKNFGRKKPNDPIVVSFFDPLSWVVRSDCVSVISDFDERLTPFWDSGNYTTHFNLLGPLSAAYQCGYCSVAHPRYSVREIDLFDVENRAERELKSQDARGYGDEEWKSVIGPEHAKQWFDRFYPELSGVDTVDSVKNKRDLVIRAICGLWDKNHKRVAVPNG